MNYRYLVLFFFISIFLLSCEDSTPDKEKLFTEQVKEKLKNFKSGIYTGILKVGSEALSQSVVYDLRVSPESNTVEIATPSLDVRKNADVHFTAGVEKIVGDILYLNIVTSAIIGDSLVPVEPNQIQFENNKYSGFIDTQNGTFTFDFIAELGDGKKEIYFITND